MNSAKLTCKTSSDKTQFTRIVYEAGNDTSDHKRGFPTCNGVGDSTRANGPPLQVKQLSFSGNRTSKAKPAHSSTRQHVNVKQLSTGSSE